MREKITNIYEINTRIWLRELSNKYRKKITLGNIPEEEILFMRELGFDTLWLMGVWLSSKKSREAALSNQKLWDELNAALPQLELEEISCSPYAIAGYEVDSFLGNNREMLELKKRLNSHGIKLILDFVPNHVALDHPWVHAYPEYFIRATRQELQNHPELFFSADNKAVLAYGKDPYFPSWADVVQLNYYNPSTRKAIQEELLRVASLCDGVRCDMAMLILKRVQKQIWGERVFGSGKFTEPESEFWQESIGYIKKSYPEFIFIAEVYWGLEYELMNLGFNYVYDKTFYDFLEYSDIEKLKGNLTEQNETAGKKLKFIENHDENRAIAVFGREKSKAAAFLLAVSPGAHLFHQGQIEGFKNKLPIYLKESLGEKSDEGIIEFYKNILVTSKNISLNMFAWESTVIFPAWKENETYKNCIALFNKNQYGYYLAVANYSDSQSQCYTRFDITTIQAKELIFKDLLSQSEYVRGKEDIILKGLYLDMHKYGYHLFRILGEG